MKTIDLLALEYVSAAIYFTEMGHYLFAEKDGKDNKDLKIKWLTQPDVARAFSGIDLDSGWISSDIIRTGIGALGAWYVIFKPAARAMAILQMVKGKATYDIPTPALVMMGYGKSYYIWALNVNEFNPEARAMQAPFPNVGSNGKICFGTNVVPAASIEGAGKIWKLFWDAPFNHDNDNGKSKKYVDDVTKMLSALNGAKKYPLNDLVEVSGKRTINQMVEYVLKGGVF